MPIRRFLAALPLLLLTLALGPQWAKAQTIRGRVLVQPAVAPLANVIVQAITVDGTLPEARSPRPVASLR